MINPARIQNFPDEETINFRPAETVSEFLQELAENAESDWDICDHLHCYI